MTGGGSAVRKSIEHGGLVMRALISASLFAAAAVLCLSCGAPMGGGGDRAGAEPPPAGEVVLPAPGSGHGAAGAFGTTERELVPPPVALLPFGSRCSSDGACASGLCYSY